MAGPTAYDFVFTNGTYKKDFVEQWGGLTKQMDLSQSTKPARVDADPDGKRRDQAVAAHAANLWAHDILATPGGRLRDFDGAAPNGAGWSWDAISTIDDTAALETNQVAIYHLVGWYDIYTTQQPFLYEALEGRLPQKMMIGPWTHSGGYGGKVHKPRSCAGTTTGSRASRTGVMDEEPVHYYVMKGNNTVPAGGERQRAAGEQAASAGGEAAGGKTPGAASTKAPPRTAAPGSRLASGRRPPWRRGAVLVRRRPLRNRRVGQRRRARRWRAADGAAAAVAAGADALPGRLHLVDGDVLAMDERLWLASQGAFLHHLLRRAHRRGSQGPHLDLAPPGRADDDRRLPCRSSGDELDARGRRRLRLPRGGGRKRRRALRRRRRATRLASQARFARPGPTSACRFTARPRPISNR